MSNESTLKKTKNFYRLVGTLSEFKLVRENCDIKLKDENGNDKGTERGERICGKLAVETNTGVIETDVYFQSLTQRPNKDGSHESKQWKMAEKMLEWKPKIKGSINYNPNTKNEYTDDISGDNDPTIVDIQGSVAINDYPNKQGEISSTLRWTVSKASSNGNLDEAGCTLNAVCLITAIAPEVRNEEETGRLNVTVYGADSKGCCFPIKCIVDAEMADDFTDAFSVGQTINADFDLVTIKVGTTKSTKEKKFGRAGAVNTSTGYSRNELMIVGADEVEEPDELTTTDENGNEVEVKTDWINPKTMKMAIKERQAMLDEMQKNGVTTKKTETAVKKSNTFAAKKQAAATQFDDEDADDELPF